MRRTLVVRDGGYAYLVDLDGLAHGLGEPFGGGVELLGFAMDGCVPGAGGVGQAALKTHRAFLEYHRGV
ncbi:hypothetical protein ACTWPT_40640 [Nonomuraea sp. 3N208]|uniref:hypothetical protein n=1 Tax=Nonomuraea sp. 3N208 TaxID=3457421 RepID=UPI003FCFB625